MAHQHEPCWSLQNMADIHLVLFDVGGVLGTNGWGRHQRAHAVERFSLDRDDFEDRHGRIIAQWEAAQISMDDYLDRTIFYRPRPFSPEEFRAFMFAQSQPHPEMIALARSLAQNGNRLMTLNNEPFELNQHRIETFGLVDIFSAFLSSCYLGARKPDPIIYQRALSIAQVEAPHVVFIDDRPENLHPAQQLGMRTILATSASEVQRQLEQLPLTLSPESICNSQ